MSESFKGVKFGQSSWQELPHFLWFRAISIKRNSYYIYRYLNNNINNGTTLEISRRQTPFSDNVLLRIILVVFRRSFAHIFHSSNRLNCVNSGGNWWLNISHGHTHINIFDHHSRWSSSCAAAVAEWRTRIELKQ